MASTAASRAKEAAAEALDRRVRPLLEQIDLHNFKQAVKLADNAIKKYGDNPLYRAVKAMALEKMGRKQEALDLVNNVREGPLNEHLLGMMQPTYRNLGRYDEATKAYEKFATEEPTNPDAQILLFNAYAREYDYLKQQQVAMKLFKQSGRAHFLMWAVCTLELQALAAAGGPSGGGARMLQLAEALLRKKMAVTGLEELESLLVFLSVLELQQKHEAALDLIRGPAQRLFTLPADQMKMEGALLHKLGRYKEAAEAFAAILRISPDDWGALLAYLDALLEYKPEPSQQTESEKDQRKTSLAVDEIDRRLKDAQSLLAELQALVEQSGELLRGPFLAEIELETRRAEGAGKEEAGEQRVAEQIAKYFEKHGNMVSFAMDVRPHVSFLSNESVKRWLASELHLSAQRSASEAAAKPVHVLRRKIAAFQVEEQLGLVQKLPDEGLYERAILLASLYQQNVGHLKGVAPRERGPAEELLLMVVTCLVESYIRTRSPGRLYEAIQVLEQGLFDRRWQSEYKLMLVSLYMHVGAVGPALYWYHLLDIKHIQLDTMSHHVLPALLGFTQRDALILLFRELSFFHESHIRDGADMTLTAYRNGTYSKVREFVRFKERLERSHQRLTGRVEELLLRVAEKAESPTEAQALLADVDFGREPLGWTSVERFRALSFNEDLDTRPWWTPSPGESLLDGAPSTSGQERRPWHERETKEDRDEREARWRVSVRRRCLLPRLLALTLELGAGTKLPVEQATTSEPAKGSKKGKGKTKGGGKGPASNWAGSHPSNNGDQSNGVKGPFESHAEEMRQLVGEYAESLGLGKKAWEKPDLGLPSQRDQDSAEVLTLAVVATTLRVMEAKEVLAGKGSESREGFEAAALLPDYFHSLLELLTSLEQSLTSQLFSSTLPAGESRSVLLPGAALPGLATLVNEAAAWLLLSMQSWTRVFPASLKRKKKAGPDEEPVDDPRNPAMHALRSCVQSVESLFAQLAERLQQLLSNTEVPQLMQTLKNELNSRKGEGGGGKVLDALQSWSLERQSAILQMRKDMRGATEEESDDTVQVLDLEATWSACIGSTRDTMEQVRTASLLKARAFKKVNA